MSDHERKIAILETKVENLEGWIKTVDGRLRSVEKQIWIGIGLVIAAQLAIQYFLK